MHRRLTIAVVAAALTLGITGGPAAGQATTSGSFTALSYNVAGLAEQISGSSPSTNSPLISPLLNAYDLVLLQEDWMDSSQDARDGGVELPAVNGYHHLIVADADHEFRSTPAQHPYGTDPSRAPAGPALIADGLNRLSRVEFGDIDRQQWESCFGELAIEGAEAVQDAAGFDALLVMAGLQTFDGGASDCAAQKGFSMARTTFAPGIDIDVYNLHADAGGSAEDQAARTANFAQLSNYIATNSAGNAVIVGGDTNLRIDDPDRPADAAAWTSLLTTTSLADVCQAIDCGADDAVIDKFAFRSGQSVTIVPTAHEFARARFIDAEGEPLSDHDPLAVTFSYSSVAATPVAARTPTVAPAVLPVDTLPATGRSSWAGWAFAALLGALVAVRLGVWRRTT